MAYNLVFEGGGAKGLVFVGAMKEFEARGYQHNRLLGTSAGAITATLLAAGYDSAEMLPAIDEKLPDGSPRFASFMDIAAGFERKTIEQSLSLSIMHGIDFPFIGERIESHIDRVLMNLMMDIPAYRQVFSFVERGGLYAGKKFENWFREKLNAGGRDYGETTLLEFHERTGKDLSVVASDTTGEQMLVLNHRTAPGCPVVSAVRMSMSIPFLWQEVVWQESWGPYNGRDIVGHTVVDGGLLSNFPIELLISRADEVTELMGAHDGTFTLGFLIDESLDVDGSDVIEPSVEAEAIDVGQLASQSKTVQRFTRLINTLTLARDKRVMDLHAEGVCRLPAKGYGTTEFDMSDGRRDALVAAGQEAASQFFGTPLFQDQS